MRRRKLQRRCSIPRALRAVSKEIQLVSHQARRVEQLIALGDRCGERGYRRRRSEPFDPSSGRSKCRRKGHRPPRRINHSDLAQRGQFFKQHLRHRRRLFQSRAIGLAQEHPRGGIKNKYCRDGALTIGQPTGSTQRRTGQRQRQECQGRHSQQEQKEVVEPQAAAIGHGLVLQETQCWKFQLHGLATHDQMQDQRYGNQRRPTQQQRRQKRKAHLHHPEAQRSKSHQNRLRRLTRYSINALSNCMAVSSGT